MLLMVPYTVRDSISPCTFHLVLQTCVNHKDGQCGCMPSRKDTKAHDAHSWEGRGIVGSGLGLVWAIYTHLRTCGIY